MTAQCLTLETECERSQVSPGGGGVVVEELLVGVKGVGADGPIRRDLSRWDELVGRAGKREEEETGRINTARQDYLTLSLSLTHTHTHRCRAETREAQKSVPSSVFYLTVTNLCQSWHHAYK